MGGICDVSGAAWKREITFVSAFKTLQFDQSTILNLNLSLAENASRVLLEFNGLHVM